MSWFRIKSNYNNKGEFAVTGMFLKLIVEVKLSQIVPDVRKHHGAECMAGSTEGQAGSGQSLLIVSPYGPSRGTPCDASGHIR